MMGWFDGFDHYTVAQDLDLAAWDDYVGQGHLNPARNGATHDLTRGFKQKNFWVIETQPGSVNWAEINNALDKGEVRAMAWHDVGHGADAVSYWQWRSALSGQEQYHGVIVGTDGTPVPLFSEVAQIGKEFEKAAPALANTAVRSEVAILHSYDSRWAIQWQKHNKNYDPVEELVSYYAPIRAIAQSIDIVPPTASLAQYKLVVAPGLNVLSDAAAKNLMAYVQNGGHLVLGQRSAMKDDDNALQPQRQPGPLGELLGGRVDQYYALTDPVPFSGDWGSGEGGLWAELLSTRDADTQVLMRYGKGNGWLDNQPAAITRKVGRGRITYIGAWLDPKNHAASCQVDDHHQWREARPGRSSRRNRSLSALRRTRHSVHPDQLLETTTKYHPAARNDRRPRRRRKANRNPTRLRRCSSLREEELGAGSASGKRVASSS